MRKPAALLCLLLALAATAFIASRSGDAGSSKGLASDSLEPGQPPEPAASMPKSDPSLPANVEPAAPVPTAQRQALLPEGEGHLLEGRVVDETGAPVPTFVLEAQHKPKGMGNDWEPHTLGTFHGGSFRVDGLPAGRWRLVATAEQYKESKRKSLRLPYTKDELVLELQRQALLRGLVLDPSGEPRAGATVTIDNGEGHKKAETDAEGRFEQILEPGEFECVAKDEVYAASEMRKGQVRFADPSEVELRLRLGGRIEGQVQDGDGLPLGGSSITLRSTKWVQDRRTLEASDQGQFVYGHVAPGTYWLEARKAEREPGDLGGPIRAAVDVIEGETSKVVIGGVNPDSITLTGTVYRGGVIMPKERVWGSMEGGDSFASGSLTIADEQGVYKLEFPGPGRAQVMVSAGEQRIVPMGVVLPPEPREQTYDIHIPMGRILGRVIDAGDAGSRPFVSCRPEGRSPVEVIYLDRKARCDEEGNFEFVGLPAGSYRVALMKSKDPRAVLDGVELGPDEEVSGLQLVGGKNGRAEVLVLDPVGQPVSDATVFAQDSGGHLHLLGFDSSTNVDGLMPWSGLGDGDYRFLAQHEDWASNFSEPLKVEAEGDNRATVTIHPGAFATIRVMDGEEPVMARLWIWDRDGNEYSRTMEAFDHTRYLVEGHNSDRYSIGPLPPGSYRVRAKAFGGDSVEGEVELRTDKPAELVLQLRP